MYYIKLKSNYGIETVDEFPTKMETEQMLSEYFIADPSGDYYISNRPTKDWVEK